MRSYGFAAGDDGYDAENWLINFAHDNANWELSWSLWETCGWDNMTIDGGPHRTASS